MECVTNVDYCLGKYIVLSGDESPDENGRKRSRRIAINNDDIEVDCDYNGHTFRTRHNECTVNVKENVKKIYSRNILIKSD